MLEYFIRTDSEIVIYMHSAFHLLDLNLMRWHHFGCDVTGVKLSLHCKTMTF